MAADFEISSLSGTGTAAKGVEQISEATVNVGNKFSILEGAASVALGNIASKAITTAAPIETLHSHCVLLVYELAFQVLLLENYQPNYYIRFYHLLYQTMLVVLQF